MSEEGSKHILQNAKRLFDSGQLEEARLLLEQGLVGSPKDSGILNFLAYLYYRLNNLQNARDTYRRLTGLEPDNLTVWSNLGLVTYKMELYEESRLAFEEYLKRQPDESKILSYMGMVLEKMGRGNTARNYFLKAKAIKERSPAHDSKGSLPVTSPKEERDEPPKPPQSRDVEDEAGGMPAGEAVSLDGWNRYFEDTSMVAEKSYRQLASSVVPYHIENRIFFSLPSLLMYQGIVVFEHGPNPYGRIPRSFRRDSLILMSAEGNGRLWLTHEAGFLVNLQLNGETLTVNAHHLVAFEATLNCEWMPLGKRGFFPGLTALRLSGEGKALLAFGEGLVSWPIESGKPLYVKPESIIAWTDDLEPVIDGGDDFKKVKGFFDEPFLRFEWMGRIYLSGGYSST